MRKISVVLSCLCAFGANGTGVTPQIINGSEISATTHPSFVSLFYDSIDYDGYYGSRPFCGATLIHSQYVLTAAHCIYGSMQKHLFTSVVPQLQDETDFPHSVLQRVMVNEMFYPDTYRDDTLSSDIAILKLAEPITAVTSYASLASPSDEVHYRNAPEVFYAVGHGNSTPYIDLTTKLQRTQLEYVPNVSCNVYNVDTSSNLCMKGAARVVYDNATCQGDSGGPLYWESGSGYVQVGITSFGPETCGNPTVSANSIFTEVSDYDTWINAVLSGTELPKIVVTDQERNAYLNPNSEDSGGGSLGFGLLVLLGLFSFRRTSLNI